MPASHNNRQYSFHSLHLFFCKRWALFFEVKPCWAPFLHIFSRILPRYLGILIRFSGILPRFSGIFPKYSGILSGFSTNLSFWGCACTPCSPASCITGRNARNLKLRHPFVPAARDMFLLSNFALFSANDIHIRSESCFGWHHTIRNRKLSKRASLVVQKWTRMHRMENLKDLFEKNK